jgi:hypothetical protein
MKDVNEELEGHNPVRWSEKLGRWIEDDSEEEVDQYGYPLDWPKCPSCGRPVMDGHITCGQAKCNEGVNQ